MCFDIVACGTNTGGSLYVTVLAGPGLVSTEVEPSVIALFLPGLELVLSSFPILVRLIFLAGEGSSIVIIPPGVGFEDFLRRSMICSC